MEELMISSENLAKLVDSFLKEGMDVFVPDSNRFGKINSSDKLVLDPSMKPTDISAKGVVFPKVDPIFHYKKDKEKVEIFETEPGNKQIVFGLKPCDAASFKVIEKVFNWDYKDEFFNRRMQNTIIFGLACTYSDEYCFCTSCGLSPVSYEGSDLFLVRLSEKEYSVMVVTEKGKEVISKYKDLFSSANAQKKTEVINSIKAPEKKFDSKKVKDWLDKNFETDFFNPTGEICLGCGQCAFVCPTCHCFDIVDEDYEYGKGRRMKNWDACQFYHFTLHASGHNPRDNQAKRYRQRVSHKFKYYIDRFGAILCTGCGRCSRGCPVGIDIGGIVSQIENLK